MVDIKIIREKCKNPLECGLCLRICPSAVFYAFPEVMEKFKETPEEKYLIVPRFKLLCTLCNECIKVCPKGAIEIREIV